MSQDPKEIFVAFRDQCITFRIYFNTMETLYGEGADLHLLTRTAVHFFSDLNQILRAHLVLCVCRLTDPAQMHKRDNLTVLQVNAACTAAGIQLSAKAQAHSDTMHSYSALLRDARNKLISHLDRDTILNDTSLGEHTKAESDEFLEALQGYCDEVGRAVGVGPLDFRHSPGRGDVIDLLTALGRADRLRATDTR